MTPAPAIPLTLCTNCGEYDEEHPGPQCQRCGYGEPESEEEQ